MINLGTNFILLTLYNQIVLKVKFMQEDAHCRDDQWNTKYKRSILCDPMQISRIILHHPGNLEGIKIVMRGCVSPFSFEQRRSEWEALTSTQCIKYTQQYKIRSPSVHLVWWWEYKILVRNKDLWGSGFAPKHHTYKTAFLVLCQMTGSDIWMLFTFYKAGALSVPAERFMGTCRHIHSN